MSKKKNSNFLLDRVGLIAERHRICQKKLTDILNSYFYFMLIDLIKNEKTKDFIFEYSYDIEKGKIKITDINKTVLNILNGEFTEEDLSKFLNNEIGY